MKKNIFIIVSALFIFSCTKMKTKEAMEGNEIVSQLRQFMVEDSVNLYNYFLIHSDQRPDIIDSSFKISALAGFSDSPSRNNASVSSIVVNTRALTKTPDSAFKFGYTDSTSTVSEGKSLAGTSVKVKISGHHPADTLSKFVYVPKHVVQSLNGFPQGQLSTLNDLTLTWQSDLSNPFQNIQIVVSYNAALSRIDNPGHPTSVSPLTFLVPDNGSYTIPKVQLQSFPDKSYIEISIGRATEIEGKLPISQRRIFYWGVSSASTHPLYLIEGANVNGLNSRTTTFNVKFVRSSNSSEYNFVLQQNTGMHLLGKIPTGKYTVSFTPVGSTQTCTFTINGTSRTSTSASILNVPVTVNTFVTIN